MNLRPGIDTHDPDFHLIAKVNVPFDDRDRLIDCLKAIARVSAQKLDPERHFAVIRDHDGSLVDQKLVVRDLALNLLVGFGVRFFLGPLESRTDDTFPNFPPGGTFKPRTPTRFGMRGRQVPLYLRTMNATGDRDFVAKRLAASLGRQPQPGEVDEAYSSWLSGTESDLLLWFESDNLYLVTDFWDAIQRDVVVPFLLDLVSFQQGFQRGDGRDHTGYNDGVGNLQARMLADPQYYRSKSICRTRPLHIPASRTGAAIARTTTAARTLSIANTSSIWIGGIQMTSRSVIRAGGSSAVTRHASMRLAETWRPDASCAE